MTEQQTPDREKKIAEIREALEKATPGPWVAVDEIATVYSANADVVIEYSADEREEDIRLIANAPEWLRFLLSELERLEREYAEERAAHNAHVTELCELEQERNMYKASSEVFYERLKKADEERNRLFERLKDITSTLGGVTFTDGRQWGAYNALCDIVKDWQK